VFAALVLMLVILFVFFVPVVPTSQASFLEPGVGVEPTLAIRCGDVYYGLLRAASAARRLIRSAFGGQANPGLVRPPARTGTRPSFV